MRLCFKSKGCGGTSASATGGTANFTAGNPVIGGLSAGGNNGTPNAVNLTAGGQTLSINGNVSVGNISPALATVILQPTGTGVSVVVNTNGGTIQIGLGAAGSGVNPDNVEVDFSQINNFICNLGTSTNGTNSVFNMGILDGNPGPNVGGTTAVNLFLLAAVSNSITAGTINIGAGGRALTPDLRLGPGTNIRDIKFEVRQIMHQIGNNLHRERHFCSDANPYAIARRGLRRSRNVCGAASSNLSHFELESTIISRLLKNSFFHCNAAMS